MTLSRKLTATGVAGALAVTGFAVAAAPLAAAATVTEEDSTATSAQTARLDAIADALAGLVSDGTLTQDQADEVATTLVDSSALRGRGGHGGPGGHGGSDGLGGLGGFGPGAGLEVAAEALGMTTDELRTALAADGATLADVAEAEGVETSVLVDAMVAAATERLEAAVADGRLTQDEADERIATLPEHVAERIDQEVRGPGGAGRGGHRLGGSWDTATGTDAQTSGDV